MQGESEGEDMEGMAQTRFELGYLRKGLVKLI